MGDSEGNGSGDGEWSGFRNQYGDGHGVGVEPGDGNGIGPDALERIASGSGPGGHYGNGGCWISKTGDGGCD